MQNRLLVRWWLGALLSLAASEAFLMAADPPPFPEIPENELKNGLSPKSIKKVDKCLEYYADLIRNAVDDPKTVRRDEKTEAVIRGRSGLIKTYRWYEAALYRYEVARRAGVIVSPLLDLPDVYKRIAGAHALARMDQATNQPAIERMIVSTDPAVRYIGWKGYRRICMPVLMTRRPRDRMTASLQQRAKQETSASVLRAIFSFTIFPPVRPTVVPQPMYEAAWQAGFDALKANWDRWCRRVIADDSELSGAMRRAVLSVSRSRTMGHNDAQRSIAAMQMVTDLVWCAAHAYDAARTPTEEAEKQIKELQVVLRNENAPPARKRKAEALITAAQERIVSLRPLMNGNAILLLDCENALNVLKGLAGEKRNRWIREALTSSRVQVRGAAVLGAAVKWIELLAKTDGVKSPEDRYKRPDAGMPATMPATAPSTLPS